MMLTCNMRIKRFLLLLCLLWAPFIMIHAQKAYRFESIPSWVDNFSRFDSTVWDRWTGYTGHELETYTKSERNSYIKNGKLVIRALEENVNGKKCTSARICCLDKKSFLYGKISVRARIPLVTGMFPAIWMLPQASIFSPEPYGEIDLMEYIPCWKKKAFQCNVHIVTKSNGKESRDQYAKKVSTKMNGYHVYTLEWTKTYLKFYIDDRLVHTYNKSQNKIWPFDQPYYIMFNLAAGGWAAECGTDLSVLPQKMEVDWIKYYKMEE